MELKSSQTDNENIRKVVLQMFERNIGKEFKVKYTGLTDIVIGVDHKFNHVCSKHHGNFHVDLCELTGNGSGSKS